MKNAHRQAGSVRESDVVREQIRVEVLSDMSRYDVERLHLLITRHARFTGSTRAQQILADWKNYCPKFRKVMPLEYRRALAELEKEARTMQAAE